MTPWTGPDEIRARLLREWDSGRLPASLVGGESVAPFRIKLKGPNQTQTAERFDEARVWIQNLTEASNDAGFRLEWRDINHRQLGRNRLPIAAVFDRVEDILALVGKRREGARLVRLAREIEAAFPELRPWLVRRPLTILEEAESWPAILAALAWFKAHPRSGRYARQINAPGVHSKFVESHRGILSELLDLVLPAEAIDREASGSSGFARRYGLREKSLLVRLRILDPLLNPGIGFDGGADGLRVAQLALLADDFAGLFRATRACPVAQVFITENEINFLAFPDHPAGVVIFGAGYGFSALARAEWIHRCRIRYWGDLDSHGFAILDQLRADFPEAESLLMDRATLLAHRDQWTTEASPTNAELIRLTPDEFALYDDLRTNRLAPALRLEQERIGFAWVEAALSCG